jgi:hypothetical protein
MSNRFTTDDKQLVLQFLHVLHGWVQETRRQKEQDLEVLQLQEGVIKLLFARLTMGEDHDPEDIVAAADRMFEPEAEEEPVLTTSEEKLGKVIDMASWVRPASLDEEEQDE